MNFQFGGFPGGGGGGFTGGFGGQNPFGNQNPFGGQNPFGNRERNVGEGRGEDPKKPELIE